MSDKELSLAQKVANIKHLVEETLYYGDSFLVRLELSMEEINMLRRVLYELETLSSHLLEAKTPVIGHICSSCRGTSNLIYVLDEGDTICYKCFWRANT